MDESSQLASRRDGLLLHDLPDPVFVFISGTWAGRDGPPLACDFKDCLALAFSHWIAALGV